MEIRSENNKEDNEIINPLRNIANKLADKKNKNNPYICKKIKKRRV